MTRNRAAFARSQAYRAQIRRALEEHPPIAQPLTAKRLRNLLDLDISERTIHWHVKAIRAEHEKTLRPAQFNAPPS
jgi:hypothetical protein